jgi:hypothetical protein
MASLSNINGIFDVHSTGAVQFNGNHGASGQILKSNGNAAPTWIDASTVIGGPYLPIAGGTLSGATATATGINFTVGGNLFGTSATFSGDLTVTGNQYFNGSFIEGDGKEMFRYSDTWLRINEDNDFADGIYCGTGILRTDGQFEVGGNGTKFKVTSAGVVTALGNITAPSFNGLAINTTGTNNVANQIVRTEANGYVNFGWINSVSGATTSTITRITASNDAYLRYVTPATFRSQITDPYYAPTGTVSGVTSVTAGNGLAGGTITSTGTLSTVHLPSFDTRSVNPDPEDYANLIRFDFKSNGTNGLSDGGGYNGQMTWRSYGSGSDLSGGQPIRLAYTANGNLWRQMGTSATSWGSWAKFALEPSGGFLPLAGGTMTGDINMNSNAITNTSQVYTSGWFRNSTNNTGLYNSSQGNHFACNGGYWDVGFAGTNGIRLRNGHNGTIMGYLYGETSGQFGLLDKDGQWTLRTDGTTETELRANNIIGLKVNSSGNTHVLGQLTVGNSTSSDIYFTDTNETTRRMHCNSNRLGFLNSSNNWSAYSENNGNWIMSAAATVSSTLTTNGTIQANGAINAIGAINLKDRIQLPASGLSSVSGRPTYAIYQEGGAWTYPYPDLCLAMHTGIKLGANASYNGIRFYDDYTMATQVMAVNDSSSPIGAGHVYVNNVLQAGASLRAPIFYDINTAYYLDPAGTSNLNIGNFQSTAAASVYATSHVRIGSGPQSLTGLNLGTDSSIYMIQSTYSSGAYYKVVNDTGTPIRIRHQVSSFDTGSYTDSIVIFNHNYWRGYVGILRSPEYPLDLAGQARLSGGYTTSDARLKENIRDNTVGLTELLQLRTRVFDWITDREILGRTLAHRSSLMNCRGFVAQEAELVAPELVDSNEEGDGCKSIDEGAVTAMLVKAIQEQQVIIDDLKLRIEKLEL